MRNAIQRLWKDNRGIATSLMEATLVVTIAAVLSSVAVITTSDQVSDANTTNSTTEVKLIGVSILSFMQDCGYAPAYLNGNATGPNDTITMVVQTGGSDPFDETKTWPSPKSGRESLDNQINHNDPGGSGIPYKRVGDIEWNKGKGWDGPYMSRLPDGDPWGDRYLCNVGFATSQGAIQANLPSGKRPAVFCISAGANRTIETKYIQAADEFQPGGDDQIFRIQ